MDSTAKMTAEDQMELASARAALHELAALGLVRKTFGSKTGFRYVVTGRAKAQFDNEVHTSQNCGPAIPCPSCEEAESGGSP